MTREHSQYRNVSTAFSKPRSETGLRCLLPLVLSFQLTKSTLWFYFPEQGPLSLGGSQLWVKFSEIQMQR